MRTATLARPHRRTACAGGTLSRTLSGERRTWTLEDRFAALRQSGARGRWSCSRWTRRCGVHGPRASLRNDKATLRHNRLAVSWRCRLHRRRSDWSSRNCWNFFDFRRFGLRRGYHLHWRSLNFRLDDFRRNLYRNGGLLFYNCY